MKIDFRVPPSALTEEERTYLSTQVRFAARFHDVPISGVRLEILPEGRSPRARVTAIEHGGTTVVTERSAETTFEATCEAVWVLDRALHAGSMSRPAPAREAWAA